MPNKDEEARQIAEKHYQIETAITQIHRVTGSAEVEGDPSEPIKLLEVNEDTVPSGVIPVQFGPAPSVGINCPSIIIEVTPEEFQRIKARELALPSGWTLGPLIPRVAQSAQS